ncbi:MAG TPA: P22 phage major capsid protein family protein, partial [Caulobacteraceae bacterium]|nr:P22 phage major capsid protein family protein [Caulobacteraceae bacterium]
MSDNSLLSPSIITKETLVILANNLVAAGKVNRQFENQFVKIGASLTVRKPNRYVVSNGPALQIQDIVEPSTSITISNQQHVDFQFSSQDLTLTIEEFSERYVKPACEPLANSVDQAVLALATQVQNLVGTPGTTPNAFTSLSAVGQRMDEGGVPQDGRVLVINPAAYWSLSNAFIGLYVKSVAEPALKGFLANIANFEIYMDQNVQVMTNGAYGGTPVVNGASQTGGSIVTNGWTASAAIFNGGEVITFAGVYAVNPQSKQSTLSLQNFTVIGPVTADGSGNATIPVYPSIITSGAYQTCSASPANLAAVSVISGTASTGYPQNIGFVKDCFGLVTVPMELPEGVDFKAR